MNIINNKDLKTSFIGISLGGLSTIESAAALLDRNMNVITLQKLFSMSDVKYFADNFAGKQNAVIMVSVPPNEVMLSCKWKYNSRTYDIVNFNDKILNHDGWTNRFSTRGCEYFKELRAKGIDIFRYDIDNIKHFFSNGFICKERTPMDCKMLQDTLRIKYNMSELPVNMLPAAQLEAILGSYLARMLVFNNGVHEPKQIGVYEDLQIIGV